MRTFQEGATPFSTPVQVFGMGAFYLATIFGGRELMQRFKVPPQQLKGPFLFHNIALSLASGLLLALMLEEILPIWYHYGFYAAICAESSWTPRMEFFYILNYMFKVRRKRAIGVPRLYVGLNGSPAPLPCSFGS